MCIVHSTLRDATTPYTDRCASAKKKQENENKMLLLDKQNGN
jgi:hypothetical protein